MRGASHPGGLRPLRSSRPAAVLVVVATAVSAATLLCEFAWVPHTSAPLASSRPLARAGAAPPAASAAADTEEADIPAGTVGRRGGAVALASAVLLAGLTVAGAAPAVRAVTPGRLLNTPPPIPPKPSSNAFIRALQAKSWALEPFTRQRNYLKAVLIQDVGQGIFNPKFVIHWSPDSYKWDVMDEANFKEAKLQGKLLIDSDLSDPGSEMTIYLYQNNEAREYCQTKIGVEQVIEGPDDLIEAVEIIKKTPFGEAPEDEPAQVARPRIPLAPPP